ncbi:MAG: DUF4328 domain-containing protein [Polyangiaceae bacterium]|nr:DUF4328 domain-containing protein [Polyangiaceae bacterium]
MGDRLNPYAPPADDAAKAARVITSPPGVDGWRYVDPRRIGYPLVGLLVAFGALTFGLFWIIVATNPVLRDMERGLHDPDVAESYARQARVLMVAKTAVLLVTYLTFLLFVRRANVNVRALGATSIRSTPGWAVGWFFVPIAAVWKPYQVMREIWLASAPQHRGREWWHAGTPSLLPGWWCGWVLMFLGSWLLQRLDRETIEERIQFNQWLGIHCLVTLAATILAALIVYGLVRRQRERARTHGYT